MNIYSNRIAGIDDRYGWCLSESGDEWDKVVIDMGDAILKAVLVDADNTRRNPELGSA